ncbi:MAG: nitroreductase family protein [Tissierellia bacterium]|nr:nitroreductase family protein [Tissierellia bacterium]
MTNFLQKRRSVRNFKKTKVSRGILDNLKAIMEEITAEDSTVDFVLYENGSLIGTGLEGYAGYGGVMIHAPHYIALSMINKEDELNILQGGYFLEKLNTKMVDMDLDTCWITVDEVEDQKMKSVFGEKGVTIDYLIGFGYGQKKKLFDPEVTSSRRSIDEIVFQNEIGKNIDLEMLENYGLMEVFSSIRYAPSHKNFQPWRFVLENAGVTAYMVKSDEDRRSLVDMGVMLFYFEAMMKTLSHPGKWEISLEDQGDLKKIGYFKL